MENYLVVCVDVDTSRVDRRPHKPTGLTKGKLYEVVRVDGFFYHIINDYGKSARYINQRFQKVDS